jgi:hypothetical protein
MFAFLFGKKNKQIAGAVPAPIQTIQQIAQHESDLEKKIIQLEAIQASHHERALHFKQAGRDATAVQFLKREKLIAEELVTTRTMLLKLVQQRSTLEQTLINADTLTALQSATSVVQAQQKIWSADKVAALADDMYEVSDTAREIRDLIHGMGPRQEMSDDELLHSLDAETPALELPVVPTSPIPSQQTQQTPVLL